MVCLASVNGGYPVLINNLGPNGTLITSAWQLENLDTNFAINPDNPVSGFYLLGGNIDLSGFNWTPVGDNDSGQFYGLFDGNNHTISGLSISAAGGGYVGMFAANSAPSRT